MELVELRGRLGGQDKRGATAALQTPILQRLKIDPKTWLDIATTFEDSCGPWVGSKSQIEQVCENTDKRWICTTEGNRKLYPP